MKNNNLSKHLMDDRLDRVANIITTIGLGEVLYKFPGENEVGPNLHCITSTGVLIIKTADDTTIITMFMLTEKRFFAYWKAYCEGKKLPNALLCTIKNNEKKRKYLFS